VTSGAAVVVGMPVLAAGVLALPHAAVMSASDEAQVNLPRAAH
jgi:hypothetical protein